EKLTVRVNVLRAIYETANQNLDRARRDLRELPAQLTDSAQARGFQEAAAGILSELSPDTVSRLEAFLNLAQQAEQDQKRQRTPDYRPEQLLALAVSGWLLGNNSAEANVETAARLWRSRQFVLDYQRTNTTAGRQKLLAAFESKQGVPFDELAQVIRAFPPPEPFEFTMLKNGPWALGALPFPPAALYWALFATYKDATPMVHSLRAELPPSSFRKGPNYFLQLPPEYHHGRSYP